jgi:hypothetical protein
MIKSEGKIRRKEKGRKEENLKIHEISLKPQTCWLPLVLDARCLMVCTNIDIDINKSIILLIQSFIFPNFLLRG